MILNKFQEWIKKFTHSSKQKNKVIKTEGEEITKWTRYTLDKTNWGIQNINKKTND